MRKLSSDNASIVGRLLTNSLFVGAEMLAKSAGGNSPAGQALGIAVGLTRSSLGDVIQKALAKRLGMPEKPREVRDLARAVGESIRRCIEEAVAALEEDPDSRFDRNLPKLAEAAQDTWRDAAAGGALELTAGLTASLAGRLEVQSDATALDPETWLSFLEDVNESAGLAISEPTLAIVAGRLHTGFPNAFRAALAEDGADGGQAYASVSLMLLGEITAAIQEGQQLDQARHGDLLRRLEEMEARLIGAIGGGAAPRPVPESSLPSSNLPAQTGRIIGRDAEVREILGLLPPAGAARLVTISGMGGTGKTRVALEAADRIRAEFPDGAWLVELETVAAESEALSAVAVVLGVKESEGAEALRAVADHLRDRRLILVLDNCEHVVQACARLADTLLRRCPGVALLATTLEPLGVAGESCYRLQGLPSPEPNGHWTAANLEQLGEIASVQLFVERARERNLSFEITPANAAAVVAICVELDGIPLALELAAARTQSMPVEKIADRLQDRFRLLTGGRRTALPRQQTLRALIDWSYGLLGDAEKVILRRTSLFKGGWTLEAAESVCADQEEASGPPADEPPIDSWDVVDHLSRLVDKSLILYEERGEGGRYRMLETVRHFARERLAESGEHPAAACRHAAFFHKAATASRGMPQADFYGWIDREYANLRQSLLTLLMPESKAEDIGGAVELCLTLNPYWLARGRLRDAREWMTRCMEALDARADALSCSKEAHLFAAAGWVADLQGDRDEAQRLHTRGLELCRQTGDRAGEAQALNNLSVTAKGQGRTDDSRALLEECMTIARELDDKELTARSLTNLAQLDIESGTFDRASERLEAASRLHEELHDTYGCAACLCNMSDLALRRGEYEAARDLSQRSADRFRSIDARTALAYALTNLADSNARLGRAGEGTAAAAEALMICFEAGLDSVKPVVLDIAARLTRESRPDLALDCLHESDRLRQAASLPRTPEEETEVAWTVRMLSATAPGRTGEEIVAELGKTS